MSLSLLKFVNTSNDDVIIRAASAPFLVANGRFTNPDTNEVLDDQHYTQIVTNKTLPDDWRPWMYKWANGDFALTSIVLPPAHDTPTPGFRSLSASEFIKIVVAAVGFARSDELVSASESIKVLIADSNTIDRKSDTTLAAIVYLKTVPTPLTDQELARIDTVWGLYNG